ncbi:MAG: alpha/beta hydrolase [Anaerolineae bacterium]|jgi:3-oxoadipate enol-lactonase|nr:alpha/beta hydrolase [Anaerolineae bacterium]
MPKVQVNGINLYYELHGPDDGEVLVLSNGIMMSTASWAFQTKVLSKDLRVLLYDCRGMWQSDHPAGPYSMEQHVEDLAGLLKTLDIQQAHIGGISYGSEISMLFAIRHPEMTKSLIVMDGVSEIHPLLKAQTTPWLMAAERNDPEMLLRTSYHMNFAEEWIISHQAFIEASVERYAEIDMPSFVELMKAFYALDITDQLGIIKAPTIVIVGEKDLIKGREYANIIVDIIKDSQLVVIPGAGHATCLEKPAEVNTLLLGFIKTLNQ